MAKAPTALMEATWHTEPLWTQMLLRLWVHAKYWVYTYAGMFMAVSFAGSLMVYQTVHIPIPAVPPMACGRSCSRCSGGWC